MPVEIIHFPQKSKFFKQNCRIHKKLISNNYSKTKSITICDLKIVKKELYTLTLKEWGKAKLDTQRLIQKEKVNIYAVVPKSALQAIIL